MNPFNFRQLLRNYRLGQVSDADKRQLDAWYDTLGTDADASPDAAEEETIRLRMWQQIDTRTTTPTIVRPMPVYRQSWLRMAAAVFVLVGLFGYGLWQWSAERSSRVELMSVQMNHTSRPMRVLLSDGSEVTLEPGSFLRFPKQFAGAKREVFLTGEAFFQVTRHPERPFLVVTDRVITKVLGTSFRVKAYGGKANVSVTVRTGKVSVFSLANQSAPDKELTNAVVLVPNQRAVFYAANARLVKTLAENPVVLTPATEHPNFNFANTPLPAVFRRLEAAYGVDFIFDEVALANCTLTARLDNESLYEKLALISEVTHAHYEILDGQVVIDSRECLPDRKPTAP